MFCNGYSLALTSESCGEITMSDEPDRYPDVTKLINYKGKASRIDLSRVLAEAKSKGYQFKKSERVV